MVVTDIDRKTKVDFISTCLKRNGKKITKKSLADVSDDNLNNVCEQFKSLLEDYIKNPPKKYLKYFVELEDGNVWEFEAEDETSCRKNAEEHTKKKVKVIVSKKDAHLCKYCGGIVPGKYADLLCDECREVFGHSLYSEL